jgi:hypothetical protein
MTLSALAAVLRLRPGSAIVHVHLSAGGSFVREGFILWVANRRRLPTVATNHGSRFVQFADQRPRLVGTVLRQARAILCLTDEALEMSGRLAPGVSNRLVVNPVPRDPMSSSADQTEEVVLFAGEIGTRKGADVLAKAWKIVALRRPQARCVLVGPVTDLVLAPQDRLEIRPPTSPAEVRVLLRSARVVALPSRKEAMPMLLTEALAAGRPFVSTPIAGIPELAHGTQRLVPVGDHERLADCLTELLADPELARRLGECGRSFHANTRSLEAASATMREVYGTLLEK